MNDPNGLVHFDGEYHLFYQHNPEGNDWGNMSWGHAVSTDLVHWQELPVAIRNDENEAVFSGSAVVDYANTSGFGEPGKPAMVAVYTSAKPGNQSQALAYSTDRGRTWTKYAGNPVLDIGSAEFRDPKVQWYEPTKSWIMTAVEATDRKVTFYSSPDLKTWTHLSDFGPRGAVGGAWECPDLFPLPVDGNEDRQKWVLIVSLNPGGIAGGSGKQYFVGEWDGRTFTPDDDGSSTPPAGLVLQDFESPGFGTWTATGTAFGDGPVAGTTPGQVNVTGYQGERIANSYHGQDFPTGTLTSPEFIADTAYINFLVGGGRHPHEPGTETSQPPDPTDVVLADFEDGYGPWTTTGTAFGAAPATGTLPGQHPVSGYRGSRLVNSFLDGDASTGTLTSPSFTIAKSRINLLVGGGNHPTTSAGATAVTLLVDGVVVRTATGRNSEELDWVSWDVRDLAGRSAQIQVVDHNTGGWGHVLLDQVTLSDTPARPRSRETSVNLLVDGWIVQSVTGPNSGTLDWAHFDLRPHRGKQVQIQLLDLNTGDWGHILADHFVASDVPRHPSGVHGKWVDFGKDYYAGISFDGAPDGKRYMIGWMSNWQYATRTPTSPWRGSMSVPREVSLRTIDGDVRLVQNSVPALQQLRQSPALTWKRVAIRPGTTPLDAGGRADGTAYEIDTTIRLGDAERIGLKVRTGSGEETVVGYDAVTREVYVDRTRSGATGFSPDFPGVHRAPLAAHDGTVRLRILVDTASVEVLGGNGEAVITGLIFPDASSDGVQLFAEGGSGRLEKLTLWQLASYRS